MSGAGSAFGQDVASGIHVTIMLSPTVAARPRAHSRACDTFRARIGSGTAIRAAQGGAARVDLRNPCAMFKRLFSTMTQVPLAAIDHRCAVVLYLPVLNGGVYRGI